MQMTITSYLHLFCYQYQYNELISTSTYYKEMSMAIPTKPFTKCFKSHLPEQKDNRAKSFIPDNQM